MSKKLNAFLSAFLLVALIGVQTMVSPLSVMQAFSNSISSPISIPISNPISNPNPIPTPTPGPVADINKGLVGFWKMDEKNWVNDCWTKSILDSAIYKNHAKSCPNGLGPNTRDTVAIYFDGINDYLKVDNAKVLNPDVVTVSTFIKIHSYSGSYPRIISKIGAYDLHMYTLSKAEGRLEWDVRVPNETDTVTNIRYKLELNKWYHLVAIYDGSKSEIYINTEKVAERHLPAYAPLNKSTNPLIIGAWDEKSRNINASIDHVRVYNRALTPAEIQQVFWADL